MDLNVRQWRFNQWSGLGGWSVFVFVLMLMTQGRGQGRKAVLVTSPLSPRLLQALGCQSSSCLKKSGNIFTLNPFVFKIGSSGRWCTNQTQCICTASSWTTTPLCPVSYIVASGASWHTLSPKLWIPLVWKAGHLSEGHHANVVESQEPHPPPKPTPHPCSPCYSSSSLIQSLPGLFIPHAPPPSTQNKNKNAFLYYLFTNLTVLVPLTWEPAYLLLPYQNRKSRNEPIWPMWVRRNYTLRLTPHTASVPVLRRQSSWAATGTLSSPWT